LGLEVLGTRTDDAQSLQNLKARLQGQVSLLTGHSGVGKTTLTNYLTGLTLVTGELSSHGRGKHTTTSARLLPLPGGGWLIDSPGVQNFALHGITPRDLARHFTGFGALVDQCAFRDCLHHKEPNCVVRKATQDGSLAATRYAHYLKLLEEVNQPRQYA